MTLPPWESRLRARFMAEHFGLRPGMDPKRFEDEVVKCWRSGKDAFEVLNRWLKPLAKHEDMTQTEFARMVDREYQKWRARN